MSKIVLIAIGVSLVLIFYGLYSFVKKYGLFDLAVYGFIALSLFLIGAFSVAVTMKGGAH